MIEENAHMSAIFKKRKNCGAVIFTVTKIYSKILKNTLEKEIEKKIGASFSAEKSCVNHKYTHQDITEK